MKKADFSTGGGSSPPDREHVTYKVGYFFNVFTYPEKVHRIGPEQHTPKEEEEGALGPPTLPEHKGPRWIDRYIDRYNDTYP